MRRQTLERALQELSQSSFAMMNDHGPFDVVFMGLDRASSGEVEVVFGLEEDVIPSGLTMVHAIIIKRPNEEKDVVVTATFGKPTLKFETIAQDEMHMFGQMAYAFVGFAFMPWGSVKKDSRYEISYLFNDEDLVSQRITVVQKKTSSGQ